MGQGVGRGGQMWTKYYDSKFCMITFKLNLNIFWKMSKLQNAITVAGLIDL